VIGSVNSLSEPGFPAADSPGAAPIEAWAKWVNAHGGINGHPVDLIVKNDQGNQALAVTEVEQLVQQNHVVAFVANQDGSLPDGYSSYLDQVKVPVLGGNVYTPQPWDSDPMFYPMGTTSGASQQGAVTYSKKLGFKRIGSLACSEAVQCSQGNDLIRSLTTAAGLKFVYGAVAASTLSDYTANCLAAQSAGVQVLALLVPTATEGGTIASDCARQNYHPTYIIEGIGPGYISTPAFNGAFDVSQTQPWFSTAPVMSDYQQAMKKYTTINFKTVEEAFNAPAAWASGLMLQKAIQLSGATGNPTSANILAGLKKFKAQTLGGFIPPVTFTNPRNKVSNCFYVITVKHQQFVEGNSGQYVCNAS
jgi:branched-chain amino acid transport system substrate-binding protein